MTVAGQTTAPLPFNATAAQVQAALAALTGIGGPSGALDNVSGNNTYTGTLTLATNASVGAVPGTTLTLQGGGVVQNPVPLTVPAPSFQKVGDGTVVLSSPDP